MTLAAFRQALAFLDGRGDTQAGAVGTAMLSLARHRLGVAGRAFEAIRRLVKARKRPRHGMAPRAQRTIELLKSPGRRRAVLTLPQRTAASVARRPGAPVADALRVQSALALELLIQTALRIGNVAAIELGRHLRFVRSGAHATAHLTFEPHEVKNGTALAFELPAATVTLLETYLRDHRGHLVESGSSFLFPGRGDRPKTTSRLSAQVSRLVDDATGVSLTAHHFRHLAAVMTLEHDPTNYEGARQLLGHRTLKTTVAYYAGEERAAHVRRYDALVERERTAAAEPRRGRRA